MNAILVGVVPDAVADARRLRCQEDSQIPGRVIFTCHQRGVGRFTGRSVGVAVVRSTGRLVVASRTVGILRADRVAGGWREAYIVITRRQVSEVVVAVAVGVERPYDIAAGIVQFHLDIGHTCLTGILNPVLICVEPDPVADAGRLCRHSEAQVPAQVVLSGHERRSCRALRRRVHVAVGAVVRPDVLRADAVP